MKKKILSTILVLTVVFSISACNLNRRTGDEEINIKLDAGEIQGKDVKVRKAKKAESNSEKSERRDDSVSLKSGEDFRNNYFENENNVETAGSVDKTVYVGSFSEKENQLADAVIKQMITSDMGDFVKVKAIHDYLLVHVDYDYQNYINGTIPDVSHRAEGALANKYAVCDGYAKAFQILCEKSGIPCVFVTGISKGEDHAWNQVKIEGNWYNMDVTWDDPAIINGVVTAFDDHSGNSYEYFCVPDSLMYEDHTAKNAKYICTSPSLYEQALKAGVPWDTAIYTASKNELTDLIKSEVQNGNYSPSFYIKKSIMGEDIGTFLMDCISEAGISFSGISWSYFTYFEETKEPGTYYKITLTIKN